MTTKTDTTEQKQATTNLEGAIVLVTGSRDLTSLAYVENILKRYKIAAIVHGDANGADTLAQRYADKNRIPTAKHRVTSDDWKAEPKKAGVLRNQLMLDEHPTISLVIAFPMGKSAGTNDMIRRAMKAKICTHIFYPPDTLKAKPVTPK